MKHETATHAKAHFGKVLEQSLLGPIVIEKSGRDVAVIVSYEEFKRLQALEDQHWVARAEDARKEGFIGQEKSDDLLQELLNAKD